MDLFATMVVLGLVILPAGGSYLGSYLWWRNTGKRKAHEEHLARLDWLRAHTPVQRPVVMGRHRPDYVDPGTIRELRPWHPGMGISGAGEEVP